MAVDELNTHQRGGGRTSKATDSGDRRFIENVHTLDSKLCPGRKRARYQWKKWSVTKLLRTFGLKDEADV